MVIKDDGTKAQLEMSKWPTALELLWNCSQQFQFGSLGCASELDLYSSVQVLF